MSHALRDKVGERVERILRAAEEGATTRNEDLTAILAVVETALVLARREGWNLRAYQSENITEFPGAVDSGLEKFTLPARTRQVLREEPVPGTDRPLYRVEHGCLRVFSNLREWVPSPPIGNASFALMAHALDLHANPYRTEQVPADESDPWEERGALSHTLDGRTYAPWGERR